MFKQPLRQISNINVNLQGDPVAANQCCDRYRKLYFFELEPPFEEIIEFECAPGVMLVLSPAPQWGLFTVLRRSVSFKAESGTVDDVDVTVTMIREGTEYPPAMGHGSARMTLNDTPQEIMTTISFDNNTIIHAYIRLNNEIYETKMVFDTEYVKVNAVVDKW